MQTNSRIGVDYSINSPAVALISDEGVIFKFFSKDIINLKCHSRIGDLTFQGMEYPDWKNTQDRYNQVADWMLLDGCEAASPVTMEGFSFGAKGRIFDLAEAAQVYKFKLYQNHGTLVNVVAPNTLKKFGSGNGHAKKAEMAEAFFNKTGVWLHEILGCNADGNPASDCVDAYFAGEWGYNELREGRQPANGERREVIKPTRRKRRRSNSKTD